MKAARRFTQLKKIAEPLHYSPDFIIGFTVVAVKKRTAQKMNTFLFIKCGSRRVHIDYLMPKVADDHPCRIALDYTPEKY